MIKFCFCEDCDDLTADADCPECGQEITSDSNGNYYCQHCGYTNDYQSMLDEWVREDGR